MIDPSLSTPPAIAARRQRRPATSAAAVHRFIEPGADTLVMAAVGPDHDRQYERFARDVLPRI